jgi:uncharacterized protein YhbP (UPF0306 family)
MTDAELFAEMRAFLSAWPTASLATIDAYGDPHAANVMFALDADWHLYFVSSPDSAHSQHIARQPAVAMTIYAHVDEPSQIHGVQLHGVCEQVTDDHERQHAWQVYARRFPFVAANPAMTQRVKKECFYRVTPAWVRWIDNRRGFGFKVERYLTV